MIDEYDWGGGREALVRIGDGPPAVIVALPPFEEANRTRTFAVTVMRALARHGLASVLPDLPGAGESLVSTEKATLAGWRSAFARAAGATGARHGLAIRAGALIDTAASLSSRFHLSPQDGQGLVRELERIRAAGGGEDYAGNVITDPLLASLRSARPTAERVRTVRLVSDKRPADSWIEGSPLWRRAEPDNDRSLAEALADDVAKWVRLCGG